MMPIKCSRAVVTEDTEVMEVDMAGALPAL